jgi:hypothetical protein
MEKWKAKKRLPLFHTPPTTATTHHYKSRYTNSSLAQRIGQATKLSARLGEPIRRRSFVQRVGEQTVQARGHRFNTEDKDHEIEKVVPAGHCCGLRSLRTTVQVRASLFAGGRPIGAGGYAPLRIRLGPCTHERPGPTLSRIEVAERSSGSEDCILSAPDVLAHR